MRTFLFALALVSLAALAIVFPQAIWFAAAGASAATALWLYFSLCDTDLDRNMGAPELISDPLGNGMDGGPIDGMGHHG